MGGIWGKTKNICSKLPKYLWFVVVFTIVQLHLLRNIVPLPYMAVYASMSVILVVLTSKKIFQERNSSVLRILIFLFICAIWGFLTSLQFIDFGGALVGLTRYTFAIPIFLSLYLFVNDLDDLRIVLITFICYFAVVSITLPMQMFTGPISWFSSSSTRAGLVRFTSLAGSMTTFGIVVGCYLLLIPAVKRWWAWVLGGIVMVSSTFALSKAAIVNVTIAMLIFAWFYRKVITKYLLWFTVAIVGTYLLTKLPAPKQEIPSNKAANGIASNNGLELGDRIAASLQSFNLSINSKGNGDVSVFQSALDRIFALPGMNFEAWLNLGPWSWLTGGGFGMAGTALVPERESLGMMAHNQFAELYSVFGVVIGTGLLALLFVVLVKLFQITRSSRSEIIVVIFASYLLLMLNGMFANGILYQPAGAAIFYLSLFVAFAGKSIIAKSKN